MFLVDAFVRKALALGGCAEQCYAKAPPRGAFTGLPRLTDLACVLPGRVPYPLHSRAALGVPPARDPVEFSR